MLIPKSFLQKMPLKNKTTLEIDLSALAHNYKTLRSETSPKTKFMAVVKANAYGSDSIEIAKKLEDLGVDYFAVAYALEGEVLRTHGIQKPILILHPQRDQLEELFKLNLEPTIYSFKGLEEVVAFSQNQSVPIHIKVNTGLNRLGFKPSELDSVIELLKKHPSIHLKSVYSHLIASEDSQSKAISQEQIAAFNKSVERFKNAGISIPLRHMTNTSGILNYKEAHFDMVRSGIGLYGFANGPYDRNLKPIGSLKTIISKINELSKGEGVGYNSGFVADKTMRVATLPIGHADGITRIYSKGKARVWIHNQPAEILGNVCMDMIMVNITSIECQEGDEVILFDQTHSACKFAEGAGTISYELITAIGPRVSRMVKT